ncbi:MAG: adenylate/guanylate cyclase domain-containing protein [Alphaproteobacteria bacterium]
MTGNKARLKSYAAIIVAAALIGACYAAFLDIFLRSDLSAISFLRGAQRGFVIGTFLSVFEYGLNESRLGEALRRAPFLISLLLRALATTTVLIGAIILSRLLLSSRGHSLAQWVETGLLRDFVFVAFIAFFIHFVLQARRIIGGKVLTYFLLGRYNRPVVEERIFMLLDIVGSTTIAQRLGDTEALKLISRFFFDIAEPISKFGGETLLYVGDEVVVSWPMGSGLKNARCLQCYAAIRATMAQNQETYVRDFGEAPEIRVGIHGGSVAAGECGDNKRQIVFIGDTINVAKRLQEACRDFDRRAIISGDLLERIDLPSRFRVEELGSTTLRGRDTETVLCGIVFDSGEGARGQTH